jgi:hypothetical protein
VRSAGNVSLSLALALFLVLASAAASSAAVRSFAPAHDGWVSTRGSGAGHGKGSRLLVGGRERRRAYLKFAVSGLSAPPRRVTLVLRSLPAGHHGRLRLRAVRARPWFEHTLTRRSAPRLGRTLHRRTVHGRSRMKLSLTKRVRRNGTFTFALTSRSRRTLALGSAEAARRRAPRLVITGDVAPAPPGPGGGGTPPPSPGGATPSRPPTAGGGGPGHATTRAPRSAVLSDAAAAGHVRHAREVRPDNATANHTVPTGQQLTNFRSASPKQPYTSHVSGNFVGSTDEIIQWAAWKWGVDEDVMRAVAVTESHWRQDTVGDNGVTFGLMQVKTPLGGGRNGWPGTFPLARDSTSFNVDYYGRAFRSCYDGRETWLGGGYSAGNAWGCVGHWFSGDWLDSGATAYIARVKQYLAARAWERF